MTDLSTINPDLVKILTAISCHNINVGMIRFNLSKIVTAQL